MNLVNNPVNTTSDLQVGNSPNQPVGQPAKPPFDNPMGTDGFEFVEYTAPDVKALGRLFESMGFVAVAKHRSKDVTLYKQGDINFIVNAEKDSFAQSFARVHGPSACAFGAFV